jgi:hypothetical protein
MKLRQFDFQFIALSRMMGKFNDLKEVTILVSNLFTFNLPPVEIKHTRRLIIEILEGDEHGYTFRNTQQTESPFFETNSCFRLTSQILSKIAVFRQIAKWRGLFTKSQSNSTYALNLDTSIFRKIFAQSADEDIQAAFVKKVRFSP